MIKKGNVTVIVSNVDAALKFYSGKLGMVLKLKISTPPRQS